MQTNNRLAAGKKLFDTGEYNRLVKCTAEHCKALRAILQKEQHIVRTITKEIETINETSTLAQLTKSSRRVATLAKELDVIKPRRQTLMCAYNKCTADVNAVQLMWEKNIAKSSKQTSKTRM